jgi:hypothetical protein
MACRSAPRRTPPRAAHGLAFPNVEVLRVALAPDDAVTRGAPRARGAGDDLEPETRARREWSGRAHLPADRHVRLVDRPAGAGTGDLGVVIVERPVEPLRHLLKLLRGGIAQRNVDVLVARHVDFSGFARRQVAGRLRRTPAAILHMHDGDVRPRVDEDDLRAHLTFASEPFAALVNVSAGPKPLCTVTPSTTTAYCQSVPMRFIRSSRSM